MTQTRGLFFTLFLLWVSGWNDDCFSLPACASSSSRTCFPHPTRCWSEDSEVRNSNFTTLRSFTAVFRVATNSVCKSTKSYDAQSHPDSAFYTYCCFLMCSRDRLRGLTRFHQSVLLVSPTLDWRTSFLQDYNNAYLVHSSPDQHPEGNLMSVGCVFWYEDDCATPLWRCCHGYSSWRLIVLSSRCLSERVFPPPPQPVYLLVWWCWHLVKQDHP